MISSGHGIWIRIESDFSFLDENGAIAVFADIIHGVSNEDDGLFAFDAGKVVGTFSLEGGVANSENFVEEEDIAFGTDSDREGEANLHAGGIIF